MKKTHTRGGAWLFILLLAPLVAYGQSIEPNVNIRTLNLYLPVQILELPCHKPIEVQAAYNSYSGDSSAFGKKWTFNHNIRIREAETHYELVEGDGFVNEYSREKNLEKAKEVLVDQILVEKRKQDAQKGQLQEDEEYEKYKKRLKSDKSFREQQAENLITRPRPLRAGEYYSLSRGRTVLEKNEDGSFERRFQNGSIEKFNSNGRIVRSQDRNGNQLKYRYHNDRISRIEDGCNGKVEFRYYSESPKSGLIREIEDNHERKWTFEYSDERELKGFEGPEKEVAFRYDSDSNMIEIKHDEGSLSFSYNDRYEVEEQKGPGELRQTFERSFVAENPNHSLTELTKFQGDSMEAREVHEFQTGEYEIVTKFDDEGDKVSEKTTRFSSETGYPVSILDSRGHGDQFEYDETGNLLSRESLPSGETMNFEYHDRCEQITEITVERANQPLRRTDYTYDDSCNVVTAKEKQIQIVENSDESDEADHEKTEEDKEPQTKESIVGWIEVKYNERGKTTFIHDRHNEQDIAFTYWDKGKPESITLRDTGTLLVEYDAFGEITEVNTFPHGQGEERFADTPENQYQNTILQEIRASLDEMLAYLRPAGLHIGI